MAESLVKRPKKISKKPSIDSGTVPRIIIEAVTPVVDGGKFPLKRIVGDTVPIEADIFRDGYDIIRAVFLYRSCYEKNFKEIPLNYLVNDRWGVDFKLTQNTRYVTTIGAWTDRFASWQADIRKRIETGLDYHSELNDGLMLLEQNERRALAGDKVFLGEMSAKFQKAVSDRNEVLALVFNQRLSSIMAKLDPRTDMVLYNPELDIVCDRPLAVFGTWYEIFIRSQGAVPGKGGTFLDAEKRLKDIKDMGFDVLYLAPIHPIGRTARKGKNNSLTCGPDDPGSPWAIGNEIGGHMAIEPALGTMADFGSFAKRANDEGLEIALDFAIQCSPDHPWVKEHPEWFYHRPDGTIKYAENPPKKYEDIYPLNFDCKEYMPLWEEMKKVFLFWVSHGVKIFRVDNPHTKPFRFWEWVIQEVQKTNPEVLFLAEAFTRPKVMKILAKMGFTQSYTYYTWKNSKGELTEYLTELTTTSMKEYMRPNFFTNTPDILHEFLQRGGRPAFKLRYALAAMASPSIGIYSGYELCENEGFPGTEDYVNSEKYEIRVHNWVREGHIRDYIKKINQIRRDNPALRVLDNLKFVKIDNENILAFLKMTPDRSNVILVVVNLDASRVQEGTLTMPLDLLGVRSGQGYEVRDLISDARYTWSQFNFVRLDPQVEPVHIFRVERKF